MVEQHVQTTLLHVINLTVAFVKWHLPSFSRTCEIPGFTLIDTASLSGLVGTTLWHEPSCQWDWNYIAILSTNYCRNFKLEIHGNFTKLWMNYQNLILGYVIWCLFLYQGKLHFNRLYLGCPTHTSLCMGCSPIPGHSIIYSSEPIRQQINGRRVSRVSPEDTCTMNM